jgi:hypothetical protein
MTDEHFIRQWTEGHERFTADVDKGLARLRRIIDTAYSEAPARPRGIPSTEAMLAGLGATLVTALLFASTVMATTSGTVLA